MLILEKEDCCPHNLSIMTEHNRNIAAITIQSKQIDDHISSVQALRLSIIIYWYFMTLSHVVIS